MQIRFFLLISLIAALAPFISTERSSVMENITFPGWPMKFQGRDLKQLPLSEREEQFANNFPGKIARFSDGQREIIFRWVISETRMLHSASDCFKALGYNIKYLPIKIDTFGRKWTVFEARKKDKSFTVQEIISTKLEANSDSWNDTSSWYWAAFLGKSQGPWWTITIAEL